ncbi:MAG: hypothetical protein KatS3mg109_0092 [Pirellulaceae bacterium]|nr:MAG: hypothetical protein KatS3mg109_0092 [Pirellulaceae bacterium]
MCDYASSIIFAGRKELRSLVEWQMLRKDFLEILGRHPPESEFQKIWVKRLADVFNAKLKEYRGQYNSRIASIDHSHYATWVKSWKRQSKKFMRRQLLECYARFDQTGQPVLLLDIQGSRYSDPVTRLCFLPDIGKVWSCRFDSRQNAMVSVSRHSLDSKGRYRLPEPIGRFDYHLDHGVKSKQPWLPVYRELPPHNHVVILGSVAAGEPDGDARVMSGLKVVLSSCKFYEVYWMEEIVEGQLGRRIVLSTLKKADAERLIRDWKKAKRE